VAVGKLNAALVEIMATPETRDHFLKLGWQPVTSTPQDLGRYIRAEVERWTKLIRTVGVSVE